MRPDRLRSEFLPQANVNLWAQGAQSQGAQTQSSPASSPAAQGAGPGSPSTVPSTAPSTLPSTAPAAVPSAEQVSQQSGGAGSQPTTLPGQQPTTLPGQQPTTLPTSQPTSVPASQPANIVASQPSTLPASTPASAPASQPASAPASLPVAQSQPATQPNPGGATPVAKAPQNPTNPPTPTPTQPELVSPLVKLGPQIVVRGDGRITKFFPVRAERGKFLQDLMVKYAGIPATQIEVIVGADIEETRVTPYLQPTPPTKIAISDWLAVTGTIEDVERVERFINLFYTSVPQIEIEARIAEVTTSDLLDIGVRPTDPAKPMFTFSNNGFFKSLDSNFPNGSNGIEGLLSLQAVQSPFQFQATLELLAQRRDVDIISTPRIAVRNGGRAEIVNGNDIPYAEITTIVGGVPSSTIKYKQTGVKLYVTPYLAGSDTVLLSLEMELSSPTSVTETTFVTNSPIIATRSAKTDVNIRDGNTFVVGGLISTNNLEQVSKIPVLGDIPILGLLFRSTQSQKQYTEVLFFITPRVIRDPAAQGVIVPNP